MAETGAYPDFMPGWTTNDELKFLFGSPSYAGLVNRDVEAVNRNRYLFGMPPISHAQLIQQYERVLEERPRNHGLNVEEIKRRLRLWRADQTVKTLRKHKDVM
jgi:hypothetical protein